MNSFGLGLVLNFVDNASAGMQKATQNFYAMSGMASQMTRVTDKSAQSIQSLAMAGTAMVIAGNGMTNAGKKVIDAYTGVTQAVLGAGNKMLSYRMTLTALYGSQSAANSKLKEMQQYAMTSTFTMEGLISSLITMKAVGVEAMDTITTKSGRTSQRLMDYAADLAAMFPNMRNVYGTGVEAAMGAFKEYIAEGNALSLKRGAGLDITGLLGEGKGKTLEERTQQVAELIEKLGIAGYNISLMGTPMQRLSNLQDIWFNTLTKISDAGVFDSFNGLLTKASDYITNLVSDEERFNKITNLIAGTITRLAKPLEKVLDYLISLIDKFVAFADTNPELAQTILIAIGIAGAFLVVLGTVSKLSGTFMLMVAGFRFMGSTGGNILGSLARGFGTVMLKALPLVAIGYLVYRAWKENLGGIRTELEKTFNNFTRLFRLVGGSWDGFMTDEEMQEAEKYGLLPFLTTMQDLKANLNDFWSGFNEGLDAFWTTVTGKIQPFTSDFNGFVDNVNTFIGSFTGKEYADEWSNIGRSLGEWGPAILSAVAAFNILRWALTGHPILALIAGMVAVVANGDELTKVVDKFLGGDYDKSTYGLTHRDKQDYATHNEAYRIREKIFNADRDRWINALEITNMLRIKGGEDLTAPGARGSWEAMYNTNFNGFKDYLDSIGIFTPDRYDQMVALQKDLSAKEGNYYAKKAEMDKNPGGLFTVTSGDYVQAQAEYEAALKAYDEFWANVPQLPDEVRNMNADDLMKSLQIFVDAWQLAQKDVLKPVTPPYDPENEPAWVSPYYNPGAPIPDTTTPSPWDFTDPSPDMYNPDGTLGNINTLMTTLSGAGDSAGVLAGKVKELKDAMGAEWKVPDLKLKVSVTANDTAGLEVPVSVSWMAKGGIFNRPTLFSSGYGVGEAGAEAVLPLNTFWSELSDRLGGAMEDNNTPVVMSPPPVPADSIHVDAVRDAVGNVSNNTSTTDSRIVFEKDSVHLEFKTGTKEEIAEKADEFWKHIQRKKQLEDLAARKKGGK